VERNEKGKEKCPHAYPDVELDVLVADSLHVETHSGDGRYRLVQLQFVENSWKGNCGRNEEIKHGYPQRKNSWKRSRKRARNRQQDKRGVVVVKGLLVLPAASRPSMRILISLFPKIFDSAFPIFFLFFSV